MELACSHLQIVGHTGLSSSVHPLIHCFPSLASVLVVSWLKFGSSELCEGDMQAVLALCHFCENHGPRVLMTTQSVPESLRQDYCLPTTSKASSTFALSS